MAIGFAFSMGAHYTGACMGMPHALQAISARRALLIMAQPTLLGATFASHAVERTMGYGLLSGAGLSVAGLVIVLAVALGLTSLFNWLRIPTSTIQILVFSVISAGLAAGVGIQWAHIAQLALIWVCAPFVAAALGYFLTRLLDLVPSARVETRLAEHRSKRAGGNAAESAEPGAPAAATAGGWLAVALVLVGALASFTMGSNDVANATGSLVRTHAFGPADAEVMWIVSSPEAARFAGDGKPIEWLAHSMVQENSAAYRRSRADRRIGQIETALRDLLDQHGTASAGSAYLTSLWTPSQIRDH